MSARTAFPDSLDPTTLWALRAVLVPMHPTIASHPDLKAITVLLASTATPERGGLPYLDLRARYEERFEVEDSDEWTAVMAEYNQEADAITAALFRAQGEAKLAHLYLTERRAFDRPLE